MYAFVRRELDVPFLRVTQSLSLEDATFVGEGREATLGMYISRVFDAGKDGSLFVEVMECLREGVGKGVA